MLWQTHFTRGFVSVKEISFILCQKDISQIYANNGKKVACHLKNIVLNHSN